MEIKKNPLVDIEKDRITYFLLGLIIVLSTFFVLLEWGTEKNDEPEWSGLPTVFIEEEYPGFQEFPSQQEEREPESLQKSPSAVAYGDFNVVEEVNQQNVNLPNQTIYLPENLESRVSPSEELNELQEEDDLIYANPETMPQFPGGLSALKRYFFSHIKYPASAYTQRKAGRVWCSFLVNKDGSISEAKVERGVYVSLDQEALNVVKNMPNWKPGTKNGQPVRVKVFIPVVFKL
ncbi:energy transducer TonB [Bacteroidales bacterium OttesenSCG-928-M06]|nr:energy transducer TonB [Bacteroidales bacterium OttesenSCG-928-M06]